MKSKRNLQLLAFVLELGTKLMGIEESGLVCSSILVMDHTNNSTESSSASVGGWLKFFFLNRHCYALCCFIREGIVPIDRYRYRSVLYLKTVSFCIPSDWEILVLL